MNIAFLITSPYQVYHYKWIAAHLADVTAVIEVRDREYGISEELLEQHLPTASWQWVAKEELASLDGRFDAIVCQTPVLPLQFLEQTPVIAQQYSLAKEQYQYGVWRAHAQLNLMYGNYSVGKVQGFCNAVAVGNPLLDPYLQAPRPERVPVGSGGRTPRLLYMPTYGDLSSLPEVLPRLRGVDAEITVKLHHAEPTDLLTEHPAGLRVVYSDADPVALLRQHDGVISDYSGAAYDALYAGMPVVLATDSRRTSKGEDYQRLSAAERDHSLLTGIAAVWHVDDDLLEAFGDAERRLNYTAYQEFREATFVNPGSAGEACAHQIRRLLAEGEPPHFAAQQIRDATKRYLVANRQLRSKAGVDDEVAALASRRRDWQAAGGPQRGLTAELRLAYRRARRFLARSDKMRRLARRARQWRHARRSRIAPEPVIGPLPAAPAAERREEVLGALLPHLSAEGVAVARDHDRVGAEIAVLASARRGVHKALQRLATESPHLMARVGIDWRIMETLPVGRLRFHDLLYAHWLELGNPQERGRYRIGVDGYLTVLFVDHDPAKNRYLALRRVAERTDWTALFAAAPQPTADRAVVAVGETRKHVAEPIDVVYTWVDSGDLAWREAHQRYSQQHQVHNPSANNAERYIDREELRYSLRALWMFAPFVRNIYLVTADQRPAWLAPDHPRVTVVSHRDIFPDPSVLPTFNSHAIEACLHRIPGLSENFLYFNDDVFLGRVVDPDEFFTKAGLAKVRLSPSQYIYQGKPEADAIPTDWAAYNVVSLMTRDFGLTFDRRVQHVPLTLRKSVLEEIEGKYPTEVERTRAARFRAVTDLAIPSMLGQFYAIATARAVEWPGHRNEYIYLDTGRHDSLQRYRQILSQRPKFFCLNATRHDDLDLEEQASHLNQFLERAFPAAAPWELT